MILGFLEQGQATEFRVREVDLAEGLRQGEESRIPEEPGRGAHHGVAPSA